MVKLYVNWISPPSRALMMTCHAAGIKVDIQNVDLLTGEHKGAEYGKINPDHVVPTVVDGDFTIWESRPTAIYLIDKHAHGHALFPAGLQQRALIHKMLDFDMSAVYKAISSYVVPIMFMGKESTTDEMEAMFKRLDETIFNKRDYVVCNHMTLADMFMVAGCTFPELLGYEVSSDKFPNLAAWIKRMKGTDFYQKANVNYEVMKKQLAKK